MNSFFPVQIGTVLSQAADKHQVFVVLDNHGEMAAIPVSVSTHGPADGMRVSHKSLPTRGTRGIVVFPRGDQRNGVWVGSVQGNLLDAFTAPAGDPTVESDFHWSGAWRYRDQTGGHADVYPDGTSIVVGFSGVVPTAFRHTVDQNQVQQRTPFPASERVPHPPAPFPYVINHATGTTVAIDASGNVNVTGKQNVTVVTAGNATVNASGQIALSVPPGHTISIGGVGDVLQALCTQAFHDWDIGHIHPDAQGGFTGPPTTQPGASAMTTVLKAG